MLQVRNETPFETALSVLPDPAGIETLYVTVKATFTLRGSRVRVAEEQEAVAPCDEYRGPAGTSSLARAGEIHPCKPATDVIVLGNGHAPGGKPAPRFGVALSVGLLRKMVRVQGDRVWKAGIAGPRPSRPVPTVAVPLVWERAFGGTVDLGNGEVAAEARNPVGVGFGGGRTAAELEGLPVPNVDDPRDPVVSPFRTPAPAGLGFVAPSWAPRVACAGTYDAAWRRTRAPFLPADFDPRFLQAAPPDQIYPGYLQGGEPVQLQNLSPAGVQRFALPVCDLDAVVWLAGVAERPALRIETLVLEPDRDRFSLLLRGAVPCEKQALRIEEVTVTLRSLQGVVS